MECYLFHFAVIGEVAVHFAVEAPGVLAVMCKGTHLFLICCLVHLVAQFGPEVLERCFGKPEE